jgi:predicted PurR-regulated permease PerM
MSYRRIEPAAPRGAVHPLVERAGAYSWRLLVIAAVVVGALWLIGQLQVVVLPVLVAVLLARVLIPVSDRLQRWRLPRSLAAAVAVAGFVAVVLGLGALLVPAVAGELGELGPTASQGLADVERWLVDEGPIDVSREDLERYRSEALSRVGERLSQSDGGVVGMASLVVEIPTGLILALILTFFFVKDGRLFARWFGDRLPSSGRPAAGRMATATWVTLGGYLRGVVILGAVESLVIGLALALVGGDLVVPVMALTFVAAFLPIVGAIVAGVVAVLVALVTVGPGAALVVGVVAIVVQQLDNDLLAPVIYGRSLKLHPVVVLVAIVSGAALFGFVGAVLAVPVTAVAINASIAARSDTEDGGTDRTDHATVDLRQPLPTT